MNNLQRTGASPAPAEPNGVQAQAINALANIHNATQAAEDRVSQAYADKIRYLQEALKQSEANNGLLSAKVAVLNERNIQLEQTSEQLNAARQAKYQAVEERFKFLHERVMELTNKISTHPQQAVDCVEAQMCLHVMKQHNDGCIISATKNDGFLGGPPSARIAFLLQKIDPDYRERVKASEYDHKIVFEETESATRSIKTALLDIEAEFKKVLKDSDD